MIDKKTKLAHQAQDCYDKLSLAAKSGEWESFAYHLGQLKAFNLAANALAEEEFIQFVISENYDKFIRGFAGFAARGKIEPPSWVMVLYLDVYKDYIAE